MKTLLPFLLFPLVMLQSGCTPPGPDPAAMIASAKQLDADWVEAFNTGNLDALMALYWNSRELLVYPSNAIELRGWEQVKDFYAGELAHMKNAKSTITDASYTPAGDVVFSTGRWTISVPTGEGPVLEIHGRYSSVRRQEDGKWVITMEHASVPMLR